MSIAGQAAFRQ